MLTFIALFTSLAAASAPAGALQAGEDTTTTATLPPDAPPPAPHRARPSPPGLPGRATLAAIELGRAHAGPTP